MVNRHQAAEYFLLERHYSLVGSQRVDAESDELELAEQRGLIPVQIKTETANPQGRSRMV